jgi:hypothetical protein
MSRRRGSNPNDRGMINKNLASANKSLRRPPSPEVVTSSLASHRTGVLLPALAKAHDHAVRTNGPLPSVVVEHTEHG